MWTYELSRLVDTGYLGVWNAGKCAYSRWRSCKDHANLWHLCVFSMVLLHSKVGIATRHLLVSFIMTCSSLHNLHHTTRIYYPTTARTLFADYFTKMSTVVWDHVEELLMSRAIRFSRHWILHCSAIYNHRLCHVCRNPVASTLSTLEKCHQRAWAWILNLIVSLLMAIVSLRNFIPVSFLTMHHLDPLTHTWIPHSYIVSRRRFRFRIRGLEF